MNPLRKIDDYLMELGEKQRRLAARNRALKPVNQMTPRQFNRRIEAQMPVQVDEMPLADRLLQMEKTNTLVNNRLDRLTPEQKMRSLPLIARDYQDFLRQSRMQEAADSITMGPRAAEYGVPITAAAVAGGIGLANALQQEEPEVEEPLTLDDFAWIGESSRSMDPADAMPLDEIDLGEPMPIEPEVYVDGGEVDTDGLAELLMSGQETPFVPDIDGMFAEPDDMLIYASGETMDYDPQFTTFTDDPETFLELSGAGVPVMPDLDLGTEDTPFKEPEADAVRPPRMPDLADYFATPRAAPSDDRDPYMTNAQKRTVQVLINAGIPAERAGRIARGEDSLSQAEFDIVTGGRR